MNIWIIDHYSSEPKFGGIQRQFDFANGLSERGHNVVVIASAFSHFSHSYIYEEEITFSDVNEKAHYVYLKTHPYLSNRSIKRSLSMLSFKSAVLANAMKIADKYGIPDVVVGCSIHPFAWIAAYRIARKYKAKFFAEVRDLWPATWIYNGGKSRLHPMVLFFGALERWAYNRADKIIYSMARGDKYICDELGYSRDKVMWIDQPMDCERFDRNAQRYDELPQEIREFIGESFLCAFTGYYMDYEGVNEMLEAAKIIKEKDMPIKFVFVGSGSEEAKMKEYVRENALDNVFVGGRISRELIPALLRRAQICLVHLATRGNPNSYKFDASKNKINEYMYSDSCIIYGTYIENQFVKTSGAGYTIEPYNAAAFTDKICEVYAMSQEERARFGAAARRYVLENNTLERLTDKYVSLLGE